MFNKIKRLFFHNITIMLVPHSDKQITQFKINISLIIFFIFIFILLIIGFFALSSVYIVENNTIENKEEITLDIQNNLDVISNRIDNVQRSSIHFNEEVFNIQRIFDINTEDYSVVSGIGEFDLDSFFNISTDQYSGEYQLQNINESFESATQVLRQIESTLRLQERLFRDIPNHWPLASNSGYVSMEFGPNIHPLTGQWYLHKGFDIAAPIGTPVIASADGTVLDMGYDPGYGFYVIIRHKYGFRTQYSHLQKISVIEGQDILQGQELGTVGNTGISTGPHLDFIILLGSDVVDPSVFLSVYNNFNRGTQYSR